MVFLIATKFEQRCNMQIPAHNGMQTNEFSMLTYYSKTSRIATWSHTVFASTSITAVETDPKADIILE